MFFHGDITNPRNERIHTHFKAPRDDSRSPARRDRDRIIYTSAFRRLVYVTQVASPDQTHVFHNRLTHSLQVAQVGRSLAERIVLVSSGGRNPPPELEFINPDVVEAACLAHDLGHPPFGHTAEEELNRLAKGKVGGFEGNAQSFRIVTKLAFKSDKYPGLDLTRSTLAATLKYPWLRKENKKKPKKWGAYQSEIKDFNFARKFGPRKPFTPSPEAQLMDWADDVTYSVHDMEDFYRAGRIPLHVLARSGENAERRRFFDDVYQRHAGDKNFYPRPELEEVFGSLMAAFWQINEPYSGLRDQRSKLRYCTSHLIHRYVMAVDLDKAENAIIIDEELKKEVAILKELTWTYVIEGPALAMQREGQRRIVTVLFDAYTDASESRKKWSLFPPYYREQLEKVASPIDRKRIVVDLIAGMTEPQAIAGYAQIMGVQPTVTLEEIIR
jgi:dGTPase